MIDDLFILRVERLRDSVEDLRKSIRQQYRSATQQVRASQVREEARQLAEAWMVEVGPRPEVRAVIDAEVVAGLSVDFQRLLTLSEHQSLRKLYDAVLTRILRDFRSRVVIPLKQQRTTESEVFRELERVDVMPSRLTRRAFVGRSFLPRDDSVALAVVRLLHALSITVITGEKPKADLVSAKVRGRIESCDTFIGLFTRRDRVTGKDEFTTSAWVIDEKAYALAKGKRLILAKEQGVASIGGIQGDYEYLEFERSQLQDLILSLLEMLQGGE